MRVSCPILRRAAEIGCLVLSLAVSIIGCATPKAEGNIVCEGKYAGHLQGTDAVGTNIWWSFTKTLVRTDLSGKVLATQNAPSHQGDLCVKDDTLYVAVNRGRFNTETGGVSFRDQVAKRLGGKSAESEE